MPKSPGSETRNSRASVKESKVCGVHACEAISRVRPQTIIRAYLTNKTKERFRVLMDWCVEHKLAYHIVSDEELERITASAHHEGVCILVRQLPPLRDDEFLRKLQNTREKNRLILFLDGVGNPHNLGAILRIRTGTL